MKNSILILRTNNLYRLWLFAYLMAALCFSFFYFSTKVQAAVVSVQSDYDLIGVGQELLIDVRVDTEQEYINAFEGVVSVSSDSVVIEKVFTGNTIVNFWIEEPQIENQTVHFAGITPGGYLGENGLVITLKIKSVDVGSVDLSLDNIRLLLNDGLGTDAQVTVVPASLQINADQPVSDLVIAEDSIAPENFDPVVSKDANLYDGRWFVSFSAVDKGSGVDYYQVSELRPGITQLLGLAQWHRAQDGTSYELRDQSLKSYVSVRALDKTGNYRTVTLMPENGLEWYENQLVWGILIVAIVALVFSFYKIGVRRRRR